LLDVPELHNRRAPGGTCISSLAALQAGTVQTPINDRKGCGGIMRVAPAGLLAARIVDGNHEAIARFAFELGSVAAAITHGHPSGYLPAGYLAGLISLLCLGMDLEPAMELVTEILKTQHGCGETVIAIEKARALANDNSKTPSPEVIETLGGGWVGEEALAISLYCTLVARDNFVKALRLSVNHSGDSDSTGSITGNILGAMHGEAALPVIWLQHLELSGVIRQMGEDLFTAFYDTQSWLKKYLPRRYIAIKRS
jgi:ADP-ribosylglycohydrolase